jgi:hypothetical protein
MSSGKEFTGASLITGVAQLSPTTLRHIRGA